MEVKKEDVTSQSNKTHWVPTLHYSSRSWGYLTEENWKWKKRRERAFRENTKYSKGKRDMTALPVISSSTKAIYFILDPTSQHADLLMPLPLTFKS